jgi:hypothetical protein
VFGVLELFSNIGGFLTAILAVFGTFYSLVGGALFKIDSNKVTFKTS